MELKDEELGLRDVLSIIKKHLRLILVTAVLFAIIGLVVSKYFIVPKYQADAMLIINSGQSSGTTITYDQVTMTKLLAGTYAIILKSDTVLDQVIAELKLDTSAKELAENITVDTIGETEVIEITVKYTDAQTAVDIVNSIIKFSPDLIVQTVKAGSVEIISDAKTTGDPVSPKLMLNTAVSFIAGLILTVAIAFTIELLNNKFSSDEDIQKYLNYSVLGIIPSYGTEQKRKRGRSNAKKHEK